MPEIIYGETALKAKRELWEVRSRHSHLLDQRANAGYGTPLWDELTKEIQANIDRLHEIESRYFGESETNSPVANP